MLVGNIVRLSIMRRPISIVNFDARSLIENIFKGIEATYLFMFYFAMINYLLFSPFFLSLLQFYINMLTKPIPHFMTSINSPLLNLRKIKITCLDGVSFSKLPSSARSKGSI